MPMPPGRGEGSPETSEEGQREESGEGEPLSQVKGPLEKNEFASGRGGNSVS